ncbi:hypothetical protein ABT024_30455 [Streptomyces sp. NPDC002812]|uniref:hypothetical protein n=1 Tax=Streptomyces sp. NPDC002812 TaxID=3154434 RepID=UPI00331FCD0E
MAADVVPAAAEVAADAEQFGDDGELLRVQVDRGPTPRSTLRNRAWLVILLLT